MKLFFRLLTLSLLIGCIMFASGCKNKEKVPSRLPEEDMTENNGNIVEDETPIEDFIPSETPDVSKDDSKPSDDTTSNNSSSNTPSSDNSDNSSSNSSNNSNSSSNPITSEDNKLPGSGESDNNGWSNGWI